MDVSRRGFLKAGTVAGFISGPFFSGRIYASENGDIGVAKGTDIEEVIKAAVNAVGGFEAYVKNGSRVLLKPNISFTSPPQQATTTHPEVLRAVIKLCLEAGARQVLVVDHPLQDASIIGSRSVAAQVVRETRNATLILSTAENLYEEVEIPRAKEMRRTRTVRILREADVLIALPVAKHHSATEVSLGIKGNLGLVYDRRAYHNSGDFNQSLADLATFIKPDLTIIDAIRALTTRGPQGPGRVVTLNTIVAGTDPVAVDSYAVTLTPWNNRECKGSDIVHIVKSAEMGLGEIDYSKLRVISRTV